MGLSADLKDFLQDKLSSVLNQPVQINCTKPVSGGSINQTYCLDTNTGKYMLKFNSKSAYPMMFACESIGLKTIAATHTIAVPEVILQDALEYESFLVLEWIETRKPTEKASELLGRQLAQMHKSSADYFGFESDNYMGSLPQSNKKHNTWSGFYIEERLQPMVKLAFDKRLLNKTDAQNFDKLYSKLSRLFNEEPSSLIHGDLWGGNYLISTDEKPYLIDPAVSYGNREFDIAMTTLFGGFSESFYAAYNESLPLNKGWNERIDLWNLYPLLLHLNLFGAGYLEQVREGVEEYI
ncbi:fructosamine kinase family protein [Mucilaginibacter jinjuensis]|uniref:Fructosamine kinase family protein n=1 Tax=Mucilaginibacter jinjuensis TaxID=1176721 RepID=A0ABY7TF25_9SPHI|nr:fructosamine kinase family protein [Mucilaginibacter jinjuensis]WCT14988.1 fructosamine kinase family protein [Mucilaginibacter jinjuensis]